MVLNPKIEIKTFDVSLFKRQMKDNPCIMMVGRMIELTFTDIKREESKMDEEIELQTNCSESTLRIKTDNLSES